MDSIKVTILEVMILICLYTDLKYGLVANIVTIPGFLVGLLLSIYKHEVQETLLGILLTFIVFITMYIIGYMAAGDVKFMMAAAALMGDKLSYISIPLIIFIGVIISLIMLSLKGKLILTLKDSIADIRHRAIKLLYERKLILEKPSFKGNTYIPYMPAIALGLNLAIVISNNI